MGSQNKVTAIGRVVKARREKISMTWPSPVHERLGFLVELADAAGENTSESEIAAALVAAAAPNIGEDLGMLLRRYRTMSVDELGHGAAGEIIGMESRKRPGRPRSSASA